MINMIRPYFWQKAGLIKKKKNTLAFSLPIWDTSGKVRKISCQIEVRYERWLAYDNLWRRDYVKSLIFGIFLLESTPIYIIDLVSFSPSYGTSFPPL